MMITTVRSWRRRRDFCGYPQLCRSVVATARSFESFLLLLRPFIRALFGLRLLFSLFRGISVRVLCFAPHGSAMIIHWYSNAQIWSLIFEGKGFTICALRPLIIDRNHVTGNNYILASGYRARTLSFSIRRLSPYQRQFQMEGVLVGDNSSSFNTAGRKNVMIWFHLEHFSFTAKRDQTRKVRRRALYITTDPAFIGSSPSRR